MGTSASWQTTQEGDTQHMLGATQASRTRSTEALSGLTYSLWTLGCPKTHKMGPLVQKRFLPPKLPGSLTMTPLHIGMKNVKTSV